jgi:hypothetical protein
VLARRGYLTMTPRGLPASLARTPLGQLKLEKVVGEPTSGWIIFTGSRTLIDGKSIRMPGTRITSNDGETMELKPRPVHRSGAADRRDLHGARQSTRDGGQGASPTDRQLTRDGGARRDSLVLPLDLIALAPSASLSRSS